MAEELKYTSGYDGATTDDLLGYAQEAKELDSNANVREAKEVGVNAYVKESKELKSNEYVRSMKEQLAAEDAETVQVYDVEGVPHKISKKELISKAGIQLPSLEEIGGFVAYDTSGQVLGLMSKEQVAEVVGGLLGNENFVHRIPSIGLPPRGSYEINGIGGLWIFTASYYESSSIICNMGQGIGIQVINNIGEIFSITDAPGKICILRNGSRVLVKNNTDVDYSHIRIAIVY